MLGSSRCCLGGGHTFGCLVVVGTYSVLISISFAIVTALYLTSTNSGCENMEAKNAKVMAITHVDFMNQDNSVNGGDNVKEPDDGEPGDGKPDDGEEVAKMHAHRVYCDCGTQAIMSFFEVTVLVAAITGLIFMTAMFFGLLRGTFLKSREKRLNLKKMKDEKIQKDQEDAVLLRIAKGEFTVPSQPRTGSSIELPS